MKKFLPLLFVAVVSVGPSSCVSLSGFSATYTQEDGGAWDVTTRIKPRTKPEAGNYGKEPVSIGPDANWTLPGEETDTATPDFADWLNGGR